jgi:hypothetical protein
LIRSSSLANPGYRERVARLACTVAVVFSLFALSAAAAVGTQVHVTPAAGPPSGTFTVSFVTPARTGVNGSVRLRDEVTASSTAAAAGCDASALQLAPYAKSGRLVHVVLHPAAGTHWCTGSFRGKVSELQTPVCPPNAMCPMYERLRTLGTFTFSVHSF